MPLRATVGVASDEFRWCRFPGKTSVLSLCAKDTQTSRICDERGQ